MAAGLAHGSDHCRDVLIGWLSAPRITFRGGMERRLAPQGCPALLVESRPQLIQNDLPQRLSGHLHCAIVIGSGWL
jgi:hypothetical protein